MRTTIFVAVCIGIVPLFGGAEAQAQMMPNWGAAMNQMIQQNMAFDAAMAQVAQQAARQYFEDVQRFRQATGYWGYIPGPVSPAQVSQSISEANQAFDSYIQSLMQNSQRQSDAVGRYSQQAILGLQGYIGPTGYIELPYGPERTFGNALGDILRGGVDFDPNIGSNVPYQELQPVD